MSTLTYFDFNFDYFDLQGFWNLESYGTLPKIVCYLLTKDEKGVANILENTCELIKTKDQVGLMWKKDNPVLQYNRNLAITRFENLGNKFSKDQLLVKRCPKTISFISKGYATKIEALKVQNVITLPTIYLTMDSLTNINQIN